MATATYTQTVSGAARITPERPKRVPKAITENKSKAGGMETE